MFAKFNTKYCSSAFLFLFSTFLSFGLCANAAAQKKSSSDILITLERGACYGTCPIYSAQISGDGTVIYNGVENVKIKGRKTFKIPKAKVQELTKAFESINYFTFKDKYETDERGMRIADLPTATTSISLKGKSKKVVNYFGAPKELKELENKIDEIAGLKKLTGN